MARCCKAWNRSDRNNKGRAWRGVAWRGAAWHGMARRGEVLPNRVREVVKTNHSLKLSAWLFKTRGFYHKGIW